MLGPTHQLLVYYLGGGFVLLLAWVVALPDGDLDPAGTRRYLRWATIAAVIGLAHPALALAARDIIGQTGIDLPDDQDLARTHRRATTLANLLTALSFLPLLAAAALWAGR